MKQALVDVSVLILFFNRPEPLKQVFAQVQKARPARLFLYQDGPRSEKDRLGLRGSPAIPGTQLRLRPFGVHLTEMGLQPNGQVRGTGG